MRLPRRRHRLGGGRAAPDRRQPLLGSVDIIADPADMAADFRAMIETAMGRATGDVSLRLWTPRGAQTVAFVRQVAPDVEELTDRGAPGRRPHRRLPDRGVGRRSRATTTCASASSRAASARRCWPAASAWSRAARSAARRWSRRSGPTTSSARPEINREVAHYTGQAELADGDPGRASRRAGPATRPTATVQARPGGAAGGGERQRRDAEAAGRPWSRSTTRRPGRCACAPSVAEARRDGARHALDQDRPGRTGA